MAFYIHTSRAHQARRILRSASAVPPHFRVIPKPRYASRRFTDMMDRIRAAGLRPTYAEEPPGHTEYGYPGRFIRTAPPIGSVLPDGGHVTAYFSSGSLSGWISRARLASQGWRVGPPRTFTPPVRRARALARLGWTPHQRAAFLRTLTLGHRSWQAWLVVEHPHYAYPGQAVTLGVVDARTGHLLRTSVRFPATR
jgi:hypothetical protein